MEILSVKQLSKVYGGKLPSRALTDISQSDRRHSYDASYP